MDLSSLVPVAKALLAAGLPALSTILSGVAPPPFGLLVPVIVSGISSALGLPHDAPPEAVKAEIERDPPAAASKLQALEQQNADALGWAKLQVDQNMKEAESASFFIAGWRPAFAWSVIVWMNLILATSGAKVLLGYETVADFMANWTPIWLLFGGMMGARTVEKFGGVARDTLKAVAPAVKAALRPVNPTARGSR